MLIMDQNTLTQEIKNILNKFNFPKNVKIEHYENFEKLINFVSSKIKSGCVVGWFQGKMEWGPRALGNRSISRRSNQSKH